MEIVVDALQVAPDYSGVGRQVLSLGRELSRIPEAVPLELRCAAETLPRLAWAFPARTVFSMPIARARPRVRRIARQQVFAPARDGASTLVIGLGDQGPVWGRARVLLVVNDLRRLTHPNSASPAERAYYRVLVARAVRHATVVATISEFSRREIERELGVDASVVADHPPPRVEMPAGDPEGHLLVVGSLRSYKGVDTVLTAVRLLPRSERPRVIFVGEGDAGPFRHLARDLDVDFRGWVDERTLDELYHTAAATISASRYEGYGLPVAESLGYGLPTIASDIPPHREVVGDAALYFPPGDASALAEALARSRDGLGERALERSRHLVGLGPRWSELIMQAL